MKKLAFSGIAVIAVALIATFVGAHQASALGCPAYNTYYNNGYSSSYCVQSYYPVYQTVYPVYNTGAAYYGYNQYYNYNPQAYQAPANYHIYSATQPTIYYGYNYGYGYRYR